MDLNLIANDVAEQRVKTYLEENPLVLEEIRGKIMEHLKPADSDTGLKVDEDGVVIE